MAIKARQHKDGKVVYDVRAQYGGMRVSRTVPTTMTEAKRVESRILQDLILGRFEILKGRKNPTFKHYAEEYKQSVTWQKSFSRTVTSLNSLVKFFAHRRLTEITAQDFIDYRTKRRRQVSVATINRDHTCLQRMLTIAVDSSDYLISTNQLRTIKKFNEPPATNRTLTREEYGKLLRVAPEYFRRIMFFACHTGMRRMEILNLTFGQLRIWFGGAEVELVETKSGEREYVPLGEAVIELLELIAQEREIDLRKLTKDDMKQPVFTGMRGQPLKSVRKPMLRTFKATDVEPRPFHTFRHFWTTMMFEAGVDPATIQKIGRWRDFRTMLKYCYTTKPQEHAAVNKLAQHLDKKTAKVFSLRQYSGNASKNSD